MVSICKVYHWQYPITTMILLLLLIFAKEQQSTNSNTIIIISLCLSLSAIVIALLITKVYGRLKRVKATTNDKKRLESTMSFGYSSEELQSLEKEMSYEQITMKRKSFILPKLDFQ